jgi:hypothetical protein
MNNVLNSLIQISCMCDSSVGFQPFSCQGQVLIMTYGHISHKQYLENLLHKAGMLLKTVHAHKLPEFLFATINYFLVERKK